MLWKGYSLSTNCCFFSLSWVVISNYPYGSVINWRKKGALSSFPQYFHFFIVSLKFFYFNVSIFVHETLTLFMLYKFYVLSLSCSLIVCEEFGLVLSILFVMLSTQIRYLHIYSLPVNVSHPLQSVNWNLNIWSQLLF